MSGDGDEELLLGGLHMGGPPIVAGEPDQVIEIQHGSGLDRDDFGDAGDAVAQHALEGAEADDPSAQQRCRGRVVELDAQLFLADLNNAAEVSKLAEQQIQLFREDMAALNVLPPRHYLGAVESMPLTVDLIAYLRLPGTPAVTVGSVAERMTRTPWRAEGGPRIEM